MNIKIKDLPENERPRERLINKGVKSLSDEELLSIILKTGTKEISAKTLSSKILSEIGGIKNLKDVTYHDLINIKGIGNAKACLILAIQEIIKRMNVTRDKIINIKFTNPEIVYEYYKDIVSETQEHFYCLYLDSGKKIIKEKLLFIGTVNFSLVHPRDVFKEAYSVNATGFICIHNHPSGDVKPSREDKNITAKLGEIGRLMGIELIDHVIVSQNQYYSFKENGEI